MSPRTRKVALAFHIAASVGWLGAVLAYLPFAIRSLSATDPGVGAASLASMDIVGWFVIVPCGIAALVTGVVQALGTPWGIARHYWVLAKFVLTVGATTILLMHLPAVSRAANDALTSPTLAPARDRAAFVVHAVGGVLVLAAITAISVFKPWGRIPRRAETGSPTAGG